MGRRRRDDERTRENRTRGYDQHGYGRTRRGEQSDPRRDYRYDEGHSRDYGERFEEQRYDRDRDREREYYHREREQKQETRRTGMMVIGGICIAVIALLGVLAVTGGDDTSQTPQQAPQQQPAPQQPVQPQQQPQEAPAAPEAPQQDSASPEQVEGMRADIERQLEEIRASINQLRLEIWSFFGGGEQDRESSS